MTLGVMGMQIGQEYAKRVEEREQGEIDRRFAEEKVAEESKKTK